MDRAALGAQTTIELSPSPALWRDQVVATISGVGCIGETAPPVITFQSPNWVIDIDVLGGCGGSATPFSTQVVLPKLFPGRYLVRAQDPNRHLVTPPLPPLAEAPLEFSRDASITIDLPAIVTSGQSFEIELAAPDKSACGFIFSGPQVVAGRELRFDLRGCSHTLPVPTGIVRERFTLGPLAAGAYDVLVFDTTLLSQQPDDPAPFVRKSLVVHDAQRCVPSATVLCLQNGRFRVAAELEPTRIASAVPLENIDDSGLFTVFAADNVELTVKVLDGCGINGHYWVFVAPGTGLGYVVTVTDTLSGVGRNYGAGFGLGGFAHLIHDTGAFSCD